MTRDVETTEREPTQAAGMVRPRLPRAPSNGRLRGHLRRSLLCSTSTGERGMSEQVNRPMTSRPAASMVLPPRGDGGRPGLVGVSCTSSRPRRRRDSRGTVTTERPAPSTSARLHRSLRPEIPRSAHSDAEAGSGCSPAAGDHGPTPRNAKFVAVCHRGDRPGRDRSAPWDGRREPEGTGRTWWPPHRFGRMP